MVTNTQSSVCTSRGDIKKEATRLCAGENFGKSYRRNFGNLLWFRSYVAKGRPGGKFPPWCYVYFEQSTLKF